MPSPNTPAVHLRPLPDRSPNPGPPDVADTSPSKSRKSADGASANITDNAGLENRIVAIADLLPVMPNRDRIRKSNRAC